MFKTFLQYVLLLVWFKRIDAQLALGSFPNAIHNVAGSVEALDQRTLRIANFMYDGTAPDNLARFHTNWNGFFSRQLDVIANNCPPLMGRPETISTPPAPYGDRPVIVGDPSVTMTVRLGPSGGDKGYSVSTGRVGWGVALYVDGTMIPVIGVERGLTYRFRIQTGDNSTNPAKFHPVYITGSPAGGYAVGSDTERAAENVVIGVLLDDSPEFTGPLCEYTETRESVALSSSPGAVKWDQYKATLESSCDPALETGDIIEWNVAENTPDIVYYQCYSHRNLGWRIRVFDQGEMNVDELRRLSNVEQPTNPPGIESAALHIGGSLWFIAMTVAARLNL